MLIDTAYLKAEVCQCTNTVVWPDRLDSAQWSRFVVQAECVGESVEGG